MSLFSVLALAILPSPEILHGLQVVAAASTPLQVGHLGASIYVGIVVPTQRAYNLTLDVHLDPSDRRQQAAIAALSDHEAGRPETQSHPEKVRLPLQVRVVRLDGEAVVTLLDQTFSEEQLTKRDAELCEITIATLDLMPGQYRFRVESLEDNAAAQNLPMAFGVHPSASVSAAK